MSALRNGSALALLAVALPIAAPAQQQPVIISDILVQGSSLVPAERIRDMLKVRPGREFLREEVQEDVRALYATRQFATVYVEKRADGPGQIKLVFLVRDCQGTVARVAYSGARHLSKDDLDKLTGIRVGSPLNPLANKAACLKILARYREEGRAFATCELIRGESPNDTDVIFRITEGPNVKVRDLSFTGNDFVSSALLREHIVTSTGPLGLGIVGGPYNPAMIDADAVELLKYYRALGFHEVRVAREVRHSADGHDVAVVFHIHEGPRFHLRSTPRVRGVGCVTPERLAALVKVKAGDVYDQRKIDADLAVVRDYLGYMGYDVRAQAVPVYAREAPGLVAELFYDVAPAHPVSTTARGQAE